MENANLTDIKDRTRLFQEGVLVNVQYWQEWLEDHLHDVETTDRRQHNVVRAISFALGCQEGWLISQDLIESFSPFMEKRGYWDTWNTVLKQAISCTGTIKDTTSQAKLSALYARLLYRQGRYGEMVAQYRTAIKLARQAENIFVEARACTNLGYYYIEHDARHWRRAEILCCHALNRFKQLDNDYGQAHTENHLGVLYTKQGLWEQATVRLERACRLWQAMSDYSGLMYGYNNLGIMYNSLGCNANALSYLTKALRQAKIAGEQSFMGTIYMNMGNAYRSMTEPSQAEKYYQHAEKVFDKYENSYAKALLLGNIGLNFILQQHWSRAKACFEEALALWQALNDKYGQIQGMIDILNYEVAMGQQKEVEKQLVEIDQHLQQFDPNQRYLHLYRQVDEIRRSLTG